MGEKGHRLPKSRKTGILIMIGMLMVVTALGVYFCVRQTSDGENAGTLAFTYYYFDPCESCNEFGEYLVKFETAIADVREANLYTISQVNFLNSGNREYYDQICDELGIDSDQGLISIVVCGKRWLAAEENDPQVIQEFFLDCVSDAQLHTQAPVPMDSKSSTLDIARYPELQGVSPDDSVLLFFKTVACQNCENVSVYLKKLPAQVKVNDVANESSIFLHEYSLTEEAGMDLIYYLFDRFEVPESDRKVPIIFFKDGYLSGQSSIENSLDNALATGRAQGFKLENLQGASVSISWREAPAIFAAGLVGGLNPCSISMLFLLMSMLVAKQVNVLKLGFLFIVSKTITYFVLGTALSSLLIYLNSTFFSRITYIFNLVVAAFLILLAVLNVFDFFAAKNEKYGKIKLQLPAGLRKFNHDLIGKATTGKSAGLLYAAVFFLGIFISLGEFLCTGQIYMATILYLLEKTTKIDMMLLAMFSIYVVAMAIPPVILTLLIHKGKRVILLSEGIRKNITTIKLLSSAVLFIIAVFIMVKTI